jgi:predicted RecA/RadA family phage recombinase
MVVTNPYYPTPAGRGLAGQGAGEELSSGSEGRYLSFLENELTHVAGGDGLVNGGDPVNVGVLVGVAMSDASAATDLITIDTEGIWYLNVFAQNAQGVSAVAIGDQLYLATGVVSKIATGVLFGWALSVVAQGTTAVCAVKVHGI